jgi:D-3-phosphoglycerate dehydrogenase / 2-oxoglutarate reductase
LLAAIMSQLVLITPRSLTGKREPVLDQLEARGFELRFAKPGQVPTEEQLLDLVPGCVGWLAGIEPISERVLRAATKLRVISRNGTGTDNIPLGLAKDLGIRIERAEAANARGVAELSIALMFASLRNIPELDHLLRRGVWQRRSGIEIANRLVVVIGCGAVGRLVVQMALGLGAQAAAYDLFPNHTFAPAGNDRFRWISFAEAIETGDLISLHCPPLEDRTPLLSASVIGRLKEGCCLVNTARSTLVNEAAVLEALENGKLRAYATDVFGVEPPEAGSPLLTHPRVIVTPHIGGFTEESVQRAAQAAVDNLLSALTN